MDIDAVRAELFSRRDAAYAVFQGGLIRFAESSGENGFLSA